MTNSEYIEENIIGDFLKEKRIALGLSLREFSIHLYGHKNNAGNLQKIEVGKKDLSIQSFFKILKKLNCSITINEH
ncbi:helix-turn-helix transcriptional regulator [Tenacibaculum sp. 190524A02b]|uniref:helix-turn-helix domain-containing protein n=1 Tax=Tenacibaculum vairaonense TaxID=3137860 RepID=UPI0031FA6A5B